MSSFRQMKHTEMFRHAMRAQEQSRVLENRPIEFIVTTRYYGGTNLARCNGCTSSSTVTPEFAALSAARKHAAKIPVPAEWTAECRKVCEGRYMVTFTPPKDANEH